MCEPEIVFGRIYCCEQRKEVGVGRAGGGASVFGDGSRSTLALSRLFLKPMVMMDLNPVIYSILGH